MTCVGFLHPGQMGASLAAALTESTEAIWAGNGRSAETARRAAEAGLTDVESIDALVDRADIVISICPPSAATAVAEQVAETGFDGVFIDANAIGPATSVAIGTRFARYLDGGVIGPPARSDSSTRLYLAGPDAAAVAQLWAGGPLGVMPVADNWDGAPASALKMAYAGWTKGAAALLLAVSALAAEAGVLDHLRNEWELSQPGLTDRAEATAGGVAPKAWRFEGEMREIATTMAAAGLPDGFHRAAADLFGRMAGYKHGPPPSAEQAVVAILNPPSGSSDT